MIDRSARLRFLVENDLFQLCRPMPTSEFIRFCTERDVPVDAARLENLERTRIFFPLARVRFVTLVQKIEYLDEGRRVRDLGTLQADEIWSGATREEYAHFWFRRDYALDWLNEGLLWDPATRPFEPWDGFHDAEGDRAVESYYSPFQVLPLALYTTSLTCRVPFELVYEWSEDDLRTFMAELKRVANLLVQPGEEGMREKIAFICQTISNRYWPQTQGDRRTISVSSGESHEWGWHKYARTFDAEAHRTALGVNAGSLRDMQQTVMMSAQHDDPLHDWYDLVTYVSLDQKKRLKGKAALAQTLYAMEHMLRMFYHDVTQEELHRPDESYRWKRDDLYGKGITANELRHLEFLTNRFNLNPRPKVILVVEGKTEETAFPRILEEVLGHRLSIVGIEMRPLGGVGEFEGRRADRLGALEKLIEEYHYRQTVVFIILDNEGNVAHLREKLATSRSKYFSRRTMMSSDNFVLFSPNFEFANFTDDELAASMTLISDGRATFLPADIAAARTDKRGGALSKLYDAHTGHSLPKPRLGNALVDLISHNADNEFDDNGKSRRPVVAALDRVVELATLNHQPITLDTWEQNQLSGYFGAVLPEPANSESSASGRADGSAPDVAADVDVEDGN